MNRQSCLQLFPAFACAISLGVLQQASRAATIITSFNTPMTENFDTYTGTAASIAANLPNFTWTPDVGTTEGGTYNSALTPYSNNNRWYAFGYNPTGAPTDLSFGSKRQPTGVPAILSWSFQNQTGSDISIFNVSWDVEQYTRGNRLTQIDFDYNPNNTGATSAGIVGVKTVTATIGSTTGENLPSPIITSLSVAVALATPLANGQSIDFRWSTISGGTVSNQNAGIGVDNTTVTAIPIPEPFGLLSFAWVCAAAGLFRFPSKRHAASVYTGRLQIKHS